MADVIRMPLLSDTMTEGKIAAWNKRVGDVVKADDAIADVETDKATMEVVPYVDGTLLYIGVEVGKAAKVNDIIAIIGKAGEDISALIPTANTDTITEVKTTPVVEPAPMQASPVESPAAQATQVTIPKDLTVIRMPLLSDTMKEGKIVVWNKQVGDLVKTDDSLADVETDKATMEVIGYAEGTLLYQGIKEGEAAKINEVIAVIGKAGTDITPYLSALKAGSNDNASTTTPTPTPTPTPTENITPLPTSSLPIPVHTDEDGRIKASPLAKQIAKEKGIALGNVMGSGDNGRIIKRDLDNIQQAPVLIATQAAPAVAPAPVVAPTPVAAPAPVATPTPSTSAPVQQNIPIFEAGKEGYSDTPLTQMRKIIAQRLSESMFTAPHFYLKTSVEMDKLMDARTQINKVSPVKISINDMMIKAVALSLAKHPEVNSSWMTDFVRQHHHIHIGTAIALPDGLIVPVIKFANQKSLAQIATDATELYDKARNKKIQPSEFTGNTFTISNLGMMDIDEFTAIINPPDACILAVGKIAATPVVVEGNITIKNIMKLTLSCDHRVVDGAVGANFLKTLKGFLENPISMLI